MKPSFTLIAGVEISDGQVGLLSKGTVDASAHLGDPVAAAHRWVGEGAQWIHVADLDAATGRGSNHSAIKAVADSVRGKAHLQIAGGIRDAASFEQALQLRPQRIVLGTAALADLPWLSSVLATHADVVAVDLAVHKLTLHAPGTSVHGTPLDDSLLALESAGCKTFVVTDVDAEGSHKGSKRKALKLVCELERHHVIAGSGIAHLGDLHHLFELVPIGLQGAVLDAALYEGAFTYAEAIAAAEPHYDLYMWGPAQP